ncbi:MAG: hypothetical protein ACYSUT_08880 [Planctomycetota bacterium]|jgi:hypothetical protein
MLNPKLNSKKIVETTGLLKNRIEERFPKSSLGRLCGDLKKIARDSNTKIAEIQSSSFLCRFLVFLFIAAILGFTILGVSRLELSQPEINTVTGFLPILDAVFNIVFLIGGAIVFLVSIENRKKRKKVIQAVNTLRCMAHVIDSHQLTKDPCYVDRKVIRTTHSSPERNMDSFQLSRYLDYCSEMLSLTSKVAFLYVQNYHDPVATQAVKDLEDLTNGLSRKIWQKIMNIRKEPEKTIIQ